MGNEIKENSGGAGSALLDNAPAKVLVVDDEQDILVVLSYLLKKAGYDVVTADTGKKALDAVDEGGVELVLLDYMLPDISGLEVLRKIKTSHADVEVMVVTGRGSEQVHADVMAAGAAEYIIKPFMNDNLLELADKTIKSRRARLLSGEDSAPR
ncbi:MAG TPA: response regulator [Nitrospirota bacterium]|jgi:hypothetical protein